jgi:hypothetical protein
MMTAGDDSDDEVILSSGMGGLRVTGSRAAAGKTTGEERGGDSLAVVDDDPFASVGAGGGATQPDLLSGVDAAPSDASGHADDEDFDTFFRDRTSSSAK